MIAQFLVVLVLILLIAVCISFLMFKYSAASYRFPDFQPETDAELLSLSFNYASGLLSTAGSSIVIPLSESAIFWSTFLHLVPFIALPILVYILLRK
jgi:hypothetical protein